MKSNLLCKIVLLCLFAGLLSAQSDAKSLDEDVEHEQLESDSEENTAEQSPYFLSKKLNDVGFVIPFAYGVNVSEQYRQLLSMHWTIGPINAELWYFDFALEGDFFTGGGRDLPSFFIQPIAGSFNAAIRFTPVDGFYFEYLHNSLHTLQPLAPPQVGLNYYQGQYTKKETLGLVGLSDFLNLGLRWSRVDAALGFGRKNAFSAVDGLLHPFYNGADSGPMKIAPFMYNDWVLLFRLRWDIDFLRFSFLQLASFTSPAQPGLIYAYYSTQEGVNDKGRNFYSALALSLAPLFWEPVHTFDIFLQLDVSYGMLDNRVWQLNPHWGFSVGLNYRLIAPNWLKPSPSPSLLTVYDNGLGNSFSE